MAEFEHSPLSHPVPPRAGFARGLSGAAVLVALALASAAARIRIIGHCPQRRALSGPLAILLPSWSYLS